MSTNEPAEADVLRRLSPLRMRSVLCADGKMSWLVIDHLDLAIRLRAENKFAPAAQEPTTGETP